MLLMIIAVLAVLGLCMGSLAGAVIWRIHEQSEENDKKNPDKVYLQKLSIVKGRSMCPNCQHELAASDLVPLLSWLSLGGKCRYCHKPIPVGEPLGELAMAATFVVSYIWWPEPIHGAQIAVFVLWLVLLVGLMALVFYDLRWYLLPNRIIYPASVVAIALAVVVVLSAHMPLTALFNEVLAVLIGGGIFYILFQISKGTWIGGGDVRLGWLLGLTVGTPGKSLLVIFSGAVLGSLASLPLLAANRLKRTSKIPFGPFLIVGTIFTMLFGGHVLHWYETTFLNF